MKLSIEDVCKAPDRGVFLAYTREQVLFLPYEKKEEVVSRLDGEELLELHMFDNRKEYRMLESKGARYAKGAEKGVICAEVELTELGEEEVFCEEVLLEKGGAFVGNKIDSIRVLNRVSYDENGMATIVNYQLVLPEEA